jgi:S-adenosylmethionine-diacylglycerol 3-amino-3-carboxypropyl transferase
LANEDTWIEYTLLDRNVERVLSVAGSGARCMPLLARQPKFLDLVDLSEPQLFLAELRIQAARSMTYEEWLFFMGYRGAIPGDPTLVVSRGQLFTKIQGLGNETRQYWLERQDAWSSRGFILLGKWEGHFQKIGFLFRNILQCDFEPVFMAQTLEEQQQLYRTVWPRRRWNTFLKIVASEFVFDRFLYKGHFSGKSDRKTEQKSVSQFVRDEFDRLFTTQLVRKNYFIQTLFLGRIKFEEGLPLEAQREVFESVKASTTEVRYLQQSMLDPLAQNSYNFVSLSDTISYLPEGPANALLQNMNAATPKGSLMVIRAFLREPTAMNTKGWRELVEKNEWAQSVDGTGIYRFQIYQKQE